SCFTRWRLQITGDAKALERVFRFVVHRAAGALWNLRRFEFRDDVIDGGCVRLHRKGDVGIAKRSVALSVAREIKRDDRDVLAARVGPDVELGPMQDRMDPKMGTRRRRSVEMVPELRRLIAHVPSALETAR